MLPLAIITITCALIFYTVGVFSEKKAGALKSWHLLMFWIGLAFDTAGTTLMGKIAHDILTISVHSITGIIAIFLMAIHAIWATITLTRGSEKEKRFFHKFSVTVWVIWLIPYLSGMIYGMMK